VVSNGRFQCAPVAVAPCAVCCTVSGATAGRYSAMSSSPVAGQIPADPTPHHAGAVPAALGNLIRASMRPYRNSRFCRESSRADV
jgi:hypothetical protein